MKNIIKLVEEFIKYDVPTSEKVEIQYEIIKLLVENAISLVEFRIKMLNNKDREAILQELF